MKYCCNCRILQFCKTLYFCIIFLIQYKFYFQAIAISATRFFFQPLEYVAQSLGHSFKIFFKEVPTQWHIPVFLAGLLVILVSLFAFSGFEIWTPLARIGVRPPRPILPGRYEERLRQLEREKEDLRRIAYNIGGQNPNVQPIAGNRENQMPPGPNPALVAGAVEEVVNEDRHDILDNEQRVNRGHAEVPQLPAPNAQENEIGNDGLAGQEHEEVIEEGRRDVAEDLNRVPNEHDIAPGQHEPNNEERDYVMVNPDGLPRGLQTQNEIANQRVVQESRSHEEDIENVSSRSSPREQHR